MNPLLEQTPKSRDTVVVPTFLLHSNNLYGLFVRHINAPAYERRFVQGGIDRVGPSNELEEPRDAATRELIEEIGLDLTDIDHTFIDGRFSIPEGGRARKPDGYAIKLPKRYLNVPLFLNTDEFPKISPKQNEKIGSLYWERIDPMKKYDSFRHAKPESQAKLHVLCGEALGRMVEINLIPDVYK